MRDGAALGLLKRLVALAWAAEVGLRRGWARVRGQSRYRLGGACGGCARCCEAPAIRVGRVTWLFPRLRALFLGWQRRVNGFELLRADAPTRTFVFRCTHFDAATRRCDSYATRPFMCRDYPRALLDTPWPELFPECGFRPRLRKGEGLRDALARAELDPERRRELEKRLFLE